MDEIVWTNRLSTGIDKLDKQHRDLIDKLRSLEEAIRTGESTAVLLDAFRFLGVYMRDHFQDEEAEMERLQCPEAELNRRGHALFLATFETLNARLGTEGPSEHLALDVHHELAEWFVHHILLIDARMAKAAAREG
jgi:hemerythrin